MSRKAQLQAGETIFVIFIILIIIVLGFTIYSKFQEGDIIDQQNSARNDRMVSTAHRLTFWSELECSFDEVKETDCFDISKLEVFSAFINTSRSEGGYAFEYYHDLLRNSKITVRGVYPSGYDEWVLYDNPGSSSIADRIVIPINLYDPIEKTYLFGMMELYVYD